MKFLFFWELDSQFLQKQDASAHTTRTIETKFISPSFICYNVYLLLYDVIVTMLIQIYNCRCWVNNSYNAENFSFFFKIWLNLTLIITLIRLTTLNLKQLQTLQTKQLHFDFLTSSIIFASSLIKRLRSSNNSSSCISIFSIFQEK